MAIPAGDPRNPNKSKIVKKAVPASTKGKKPKFIKRPHRKNDDDEPDVDAMLAEGPIEWETEPQMVNRLSVAATVTHSAIKTKSQRGAEIRFSSVLATDEQFWERDQKISDQGWAKINLGWLEGQPIAFLVIKNHGDRQPPRIPTAEEKAVMDSKVVWVSESLTAPGPDESFPRILGSWEILPGQGMMGRPRPGKVFWLRCQNGETEVTVSAVPA